MEEVISILFMLLISSTKFFFAPTTAFVSGYSYLETIGLTISGGFLGVLIFFYFGELLKKIFKNFRFFKKRKEKRTFTKRNKRILRIRNKYGLIGLSLLTPILFSIPLGSLLAARFFDHDRRTIPFLLASVILWSFILTTITFLLE